MKRKILDYLELFWEFFKIGLFTFGGGYVMLSTMQRVIVEKKKWLTDDQMFDLLAIAESTPGPFAVNAATYIGYKRFKFFGSFLATLGVVLPSFIIIILISIFLNYFKTNIYIQNFLKGIKAGVGFLILKASYKFSNKVSKTYFNIIIFFIAFIIAFLTNISLILLLLILASVAVALVMLKLDKKFLNGEEDDV